MAEIKPQLLMSIHVPVYKKDPSGCNYKLECFGRITAAVHPNAPFEAAWNALMHLERSPAAFFLSGDKTTYSCISNESEILHEVWNYKLEDKYSLVQGSRESPNGVVIQNETAILFVERGFLRTLPIPDRKEVFLYSIPVINMRTHLQREQYRQKEVYLRLRNNFQFVDLHMNLVVGCQRIEDGKVQKKRKRNNAVPSA
tara:strand:+ start:873 stop:1469 length:597 start_codon:yes stop_codon:yes gene_type:complete